MANGNGNRRGNWGTSTRQSEHVEGRERLRRGGGQYDAGPGVETLPTSPMMDRPPSSQGTFVRTGTARGSIDSQQRKIQDQDNRGR